MPRGWNDSLSRTWENPDEDAIAQKVSDIRLRPLLTEATNGRAPWAFQ
jgi:hypothetical protein